MPIEQGSSGNNNVGIGNSNPNAMLTVGGGAPLFLNQGASSTTPFLAVLNSAYPTDARYGWAFYDNSTNGNLDIFRRNGTSQGIQFMSFNRNTGDVAIGESSPLFLNHGSSNSTPFLAVLNSVNPTDAKYGWAFYDNSTNGNLDIFRRNGTSQGIKLMSFNRNTGDVAIGESTPLYLNHGASNSTPFLAVLNSVNPTDAKYGWAFYDNPINGNLDIFRRNGTSQGIQLMSFDRNSGDVSIGTSNSNGNKLAVRGTIGCEEIVVKSASTWNWPDYVFSKDYKLKSLQEVKEYVEENHHLPEIPSAQEIEKKGFMLAEMNMNLLKKIEELTLYMIDQEKKTEQLKSIILKQNEIILNQSKRLEKLENKL
ncbi:hypothetical protein LPB248_01305 [Flavobacterium sp. LPB0248]|uniref:hypothetical protein n=1 Tax=Flavobacterium sp. LPB0248 TaxID=2614441 RepID=UPI0015A5CF47|nr:hypothetical protein [Flavobacterium sp. LPB0248]QLC64959.1 hypothetical protein LPB248_01305 [Flavobacterium sp. LPB0248]